MQQDELVAAARRKLAAMLGETALYAAWRIYAVMDGALFDNLPRLLENEGLAHRSLYQEDDLALGGPWLVDPYHLPDHEEAANEIVGDQGFRRPGANSASADPVRQLDAILRIATEVDAVVFWIGDALFSEIALYRHLRTINKVLVPRDPAAPTKKGSWNNEDTVFPPSDTSHEPVAFRHADANVMAQVLPTLTPPQLSRLFGPAKYLLFLPQPEWGGEVRRVNRSIDLPNPPVGPLCLTKEQMAEIGGVRLDRLRRKIVSYLREVAPDETASMTEQQLTRVTTQYMAEAHALGVTTELAFAKWSYMRAVGTHAGHLDKVHLFMIDRSISDHPNERVDYLILFRLQQLIVAPAIGVIPPAIQTLLQAFGIAAAGTAANAALPKGGDNSMAVSNANAKAETKFTDQTSHRSVFTCDPPQCK